MSTYTIYHQSPGLCGPASLKTVFDNIGIIKSEADWAALSCASKEQGVSIEGLIKAIHETGYTALHKRNATIQDIKQALKTKQHVIVNYWQDNVGHYSPVIDINNEVITIADVATGELIKTRIHVFERNWFDFAEYPPRFQGDLLLREMIVITD